MLNHATTHILNDVKNVLGFFALSIIKLNSFIEFYNFHSINKGVF